MRQRIDHQAHPPDHQDRTDRLATERQRKTTDERVAHKAELGERSERNLIRRDRARR